MQTQVIPYLRELLKDGHEISLLTFEPDIKAKWTAEQIDRRRGELAAIGIRWDCLAYHKRPSAIATAYDIIRGALNVRSFIEFEQPDILHCRVHVPGLIALIARSLSRHKPKLLFDIRGFFPEEFVDAGIWPKNGILFRAAKTVERHIMGASEGFVVLTEKAREILFPGSSDTGYDKLGRPVEVIPCCIDKKRFQAMSPDERKKARSELGLTDRKVIAYAGSFGGWYLTDEMIEFFVTARYVDPEMFVLILTQRDLGKVEQMMTSRGFTRSDFLVKSVPPDEISRYLNSADFAVSFIKSCYSKLSSSPTKNAEYLACGLPFIANPGIGDVDDLIDTNGVGILLDDLSRESYLKALKALDELGDVSDRCHETAFREFDLETVGGIRYRQLYERMVKNSIIID